MRRGRPKDWHTSWSTTTANMRVLILKILHLLPSSQKLRYICQVVLCCIKVALTCSIICLPFLLLAGSQVSEVSLSSLSQASSLALIQGIQLPMNSVAAFQMSNSHIACFLILLMNNKRCYIANLFFLFLPCSKKVVILNPKWNECSAGVQK